MLDTNTMFGANLGLHMEMGPDDVSVTQHKQENFNPVFDDSVTL